MLLLRLERAESWYIAVSVEFVRIKPPYSKNCGIEGGGYSEPIFPDIWDPNIDDFSQKFRACGAKKLDF